MSNFLPSEMARLILGYLEGKGYAKTANSMLEEIPELQEIALQKRKGEKVNLRVGDYTLKVMLDDYASSKDIIQENIENHPATFSAIERIQSLNKQVLCLTKIAVKNNTNNAPGYLRKHIKRVETSKIRPCPIEIRVDDEAASITSSQLKFPNEDHKSNPASSDEFSNGNDDLLQPCVTPPPLTHSPSKRKGSAKKFDQTSNKNLESARKLDPSTEKYVKALMEDTEIHASIANSINKHLMSLELDKTSAKKSRPGQISNESVKNPNQSPSTSQNLRFESSSYCGNTADSSDFSLGLSANVISDLSLELTSGLLSECSYDDKQQTSSVVGCVNNALSPSRGLSTPVPSFYPPPGSASESLFNPLSLSSNQSKRDLSNGTADVSTFPDGERLPAIEMSLSATDSFHVEPEELPSDSTESQLLDGAATTDSNQSFINNILNNTHSNTEVPSNMSFSSLLPAESDPKIIQSKPIQNDEPMCYNTVSNSVVFTKSSAATVDNSRTLMAPPQMTRVVTGRLANPNLPAQQHVVTQNPRPVEELSANGSGLKVVSGAGSQVVEILMKDMTDVMTPNAITVVPVVPFDIIDPRNLKKERVVEAWRRPNHHIRDRSKDIQRSKEKLLKAKEQKRLEEEERQNKSAGGSIESLSTSKTEIASKCSSEQELLSMPDCINGPIETESNEVTESREKQTDSVLQEDVAIYDKGSNIDKPTMKNSLECSAVENITEVQEDSTTLMSNTPTVFIPQNVQIDINVDAEALVDQLENNDVDEVIKNCNRLSANQSSFNLNSSHRDSPNFKALQLFSKSFALTEVQHRLDVTATNVSPLIMNQRHKGSLSTPRQKGYVRALDFGTPRKTNSLKKSSVKASLVFESPPSRNPGLVINKISYDRVGVRKLKCIDEVSERVVESDLALSDDESTINSPFRGSILKPSFEGEISDSSLQTPDKISFDIPLVSLEPTTPFAPISNFHGLVSSSSGGLNTPILHPFTPSSGCSVLKAYPQGPYSDSSEGTYYQPSERSEGGSERLENFDTDQKYLDSPIYEKLDYNLLINPSDQIKSSTKNGAPTPESSSVSQQDNNMQTKQPDVENVSAVTNEKVSSSILKSTNTLAPKWKKESNSKLKTNILSLETDLTTEIDVVSSVNRDEMTIERNDSINIVAPKINRKSVDETSAYDQISNDPKKEIKLLNCAKRNKSLNKSKTDTITEKQDLDDKNNPLIKKDIKNKSKAKKKKDKDSELSHKTRVDDIKENLKQTSKSSLEVVNKKIIVDKIGKTQNEQNLSQKNATPKTQVKSNKSESKKLQKPSDVGSKLIKGDEKETKKELNNKRQVTDEKKEKELNNKGEVTQKNSTKNVKRKNEKTATGKKVEQLEINLINKDDKRKREKSVKTKLKSLEELNETEKINKKRTKATSEDNNEERRAKRDKKEVSSNEKKKITHRQMTTRKSKEDLESSTGSCHISVGEISVEYVMADKAETIRKSPPIKCSSYEPTPATNKRQLPGLTIEHVSSSGHENCPPRRITDTAHPPVTVSLIRNILTKEFRDEDMPPSPCQDSSPKEKKVFTQWGKKITPQSVSVVQSSSIPSSKDLLRNRWLNKVSENKKEMGEITITPVKDVPQLTNLYEKSSLGSNLSSQLKYNLRSPRQRSPSSKNLSTFIGDKKMHRSKSQERASGSSVTPVKSLSLDVNESNSSIVEYQEIERQLAVLDGRVNDSPAIRESLLGTSDDEINLSGVFTPSQKTPKHDLHKSNPSQRKALFTQSKSPLMSFKRIPAGTPEKKVHQICHDVVKDHGAMIAFPSKSHDSIDSKQPFTTWLEKQSFDSFGVCKTREKSSINNEKREDQSLDGSTSTGESSSGSSSDSSSSSDDSSDSDSSSSEDVTSIGFDDCSQCQRFEEKKKRHKAQKTKVEGPNIQSASQKKTLRETERNVNERSDISIQVFSQCSSSSTQIKSDINPLSQTSSHQNSISNDNEYDSDEDTSVLTFSPFLELITLNLGPGSTPKTNFLRRRKLSNSSTTKRNNDDTVDSSPSLQVPDCTVTENCDVSNVDESFMDSLMISDSSFESADEMGPSRFRDTKTYQNRRLRKKLNAKEMTDSKKPSNHTTSICKEDKKLTTIIEGVQSECLIDKLNPTASKNENSSSPLPSKLSANSSFSNEPKSSTKSEDSREKIQSSISSSTSSSSSSSHLSSSSPSDTSSRTSSGTSCASKLSPSSQLPVNGSNKKVIVSNESLFGSISSCSSDVGNDNSNSKPSKSFQSDDSNASNKTISPLCKTSTTFPIISLKRLKPQKKSTMTSNSKSPSRKMNEKSPQNRKQMTKNESNSSNKKDRKRKVDDASLNNGIKLSDETLRQSKRSRKKIDLSPTILSTANVDNDVSSRPQEIEIKTPGKYFDSDVMSNTFVGFPRMNDGPCGMSVPGCSSTYDQIFGNELSFSIPETPGKDLFGPTIASNSSSVATLPPSDLKSPKSISKKKKKEIIEDSPKTKEIDPSSAIGRLLTDNKQQQELIKTIKKTGLEALLKKINSKR